MPAKKASTSKASKTSGKTRTKKKKQPFSIIQFFKDQVAAYRKAKKDAKTYYKKHRFAIVSLTIITFVIATFTVSKVTSWVGNIKEAEFQAAKEENQRRKDAKILAELKIDEDIKAAKAQVIVDKRLGVVAIYNKKEDAMSDLYRGRFVKWAKEQGFDGIVFGQVQPMFDGSYKFSTYNGQNIVSLDHVVEKLKLKECKNVISLMENKSKFPLPFPFKDQIDGDLKIYEKNVKFAGFIPTWNYEIVIKADNFYATMDHDGNIDGRTTTIKPWEIELKGAKR